MDSVEELRAEKERLRKIVSFYRDQASRLLKDGAKVNLAATVATPEQQRLLRFLKAQGKESVAEELLLPETLTREDASRRVGLIRSLIEEVNSSAGMDKETKRRVRQVLANLSISAKRTVAVGKRRCSSASC